MEAEKAQKASELLKCKNRLQQLVSSTDGIDNINSLNGIIQSYQLDDDEFSDMNNRINVLLEKTVTMVKQLLINKVNNISTQIENL